MRAMPRTKVVLVWCLILSIAVLAALEIRPKRAAILNDIPVAQSTPVVPEEKIEIEAPAPIPAVLPADHIYEPPQP